MSFNQLLIPIAPEQPLDESFHQAFRFANQISAQVTLLTVIEDLAELKEISRFSCTTLDLIDKSTKIYHGILKEWVQVLKQEYTNIKFQTKIRIGIPFIEIIKEANDSQATMVILDTHREAKEKACQRGSTTLHIMRKSEVPIWSISTAPRPVKNIVAALDISNQDYREFNEKILALAVEFCSITGANLTVCHAWRLDSEGFLRKWSGYDDLDIALISKKMRDDRVGRLRSLLMPYENSPIHTSIKILEGETRQILPKYVNEEGADLVILGSLSRTGIAGFLMGNTAESLLNEINCSVITLKPDDFTSPVLDEG
ncbi:universal stress protein [Photobacterium rosenbergii]|uniref:Universal stress protein n=1 Tax=Photobacterium rosenbergii TaxID=294936 RepID=A0ABU3ZE42_9GAMM|nr:universal stress protein [Photobacterium rosenbergii]MDV5168365.1 universal stress protein [Photobacterium rosenbergii]